MNKRLFILIALFTSLLWGRYSQAGERAGTVVAVKGTVLLMRGGTAEGISLRLMDELFVRDRLSTGKDAMVKILLTDNSVVTIDANSSVDIAEYAYDTQKRVHSSVLDIIIGRIRAQVNSFGFPDEEYTARTNNAVAGVKGTDFVVEAVSGTLTKVFVIEGTVEVKNIYLPEVVRVLNAGQFTEVLEKKAPRIPEVIKDSILTGLKQELALKDEVIRPSLPPGFAPLKVKERVTGEDARVNTVTQSALKPGGAAASQQFVSPQAAGQMGQEPPRVGIILPGSTTSKSAAPGSQPVAPVSKPPSSGPRDNILDAF